MRRPRRPGVCLWVALALVLMGLLAAAANPAQAPPQPSPEVRALLDQGKAAEGRPASEDAANLYRQALQLARERKDRPGEAAALTGLGRSIYYQKPLDALTHLEQALPIYVDLQDRPGQGLCLLLLGNAAQISSQPQRALDYYAAAAKIAEEIGNKAAYATALSNAGTVYIRTGQPYRALDNLTRALAVYEGEGKKDGILRTLGNLGAAYRVARDMPKSVETLEKALALACELGSRHDEGIILSNIGIGQLILTGPQKALECYDLALPLLEEAGDRRTVAAVLTSIAQARRVEGEFFKSLEFAHRALDMHRDIGDRLGMERTARTLAALYDEVGQQAAALEYCQQALQWSREASDVLGEMMTLNDLGELYGRSGQQKLEQDCYQQSLRLHDRDRNNFKDARAQTLLQLAGSLTGSGKHREALAYCEEARGLSDEAGDVTGEARAELQAGHGLVRLGQIAEARTRYERALKLFQDVGSAGGEAAAAAALGAVEEQRPAEAEAHYTQALRLLEAARASLGRLTEAKTGYLEQHLTVYQRYIRLLLRTGQNARAFEWTQKAKARVLADLMESGSVDLSREMTEADRKQEQDIRRREKLLSQQGQAAAAVMEDLQRQAPPDRSRQEQAKAKVEGIRQQQQQIEREWAAFQEQMYRRNPRLAQQRAARVATLEEAAAVLPADTALLEYCSLATGRGAPERAGQERDEVALFVVTRDSGGPPRLEACRITAEPGSLARLAAELRQACAGRPGTPAARPYQGAARRLYQLLIAPAAPALAGKRRLVVCPDGPLWDVPFQALVAEGQEGSGQRAKGTKSERSTLNAQRSTAPFLWERYALAYGYSATGMKAALDARGRPDRPRPPKALLVLANPLQKDEGRRMKDEEGGPSAVSSLPEEPKPVPPTPNAQRPMPRTNLPARGLYLRSRGGLGALPATQVEARTIAASFPGATVKLGEEAQESLVKETGASYHRLHFATHAVFNDAAPLLSGVVLARPPKESPEDGVLTARELFGMSLPADLVVLSACDTARGARRGGEGVIGLTWALFVAGSPSQVVSQWEVDDAATAQLMSGFYRGLKSGKPKDAALRGSALSLLRDGKHRHPFYWAPFLVMGDWR